MPTITIRRPGANTPVSGTVVNTDANGVYQFTVPAYNTMTVEVNGAGGGCMNSGSVQGSAFAGTFSAFSAAQNIVGNGGGGGSISFVPTIYFSGTRGSNGTGVGGDTNTTGGGGSGDPNGGGQNVDNEPDGGNGGRAVKTFVMNGSGAPAPNSVIQVTAGVGGNNSNGSRGVSQDGWVVITYDLAPVAGFNLAMMGM